MPGRVVSVYEVGGSARADVDFRGERREVSLDLVPETAAGDWVLVHLGMALDRLDEQTALETLALFEEAGLLDGVDGGTAALPGP